MNKCHSITTSFFLFAGAMDLTGADAEIQFIENR
jgi:hypothetical protein